MAAQKFVYKEAKRLGISDPILAASVYTDDQQVTDRPPIPVWRHTIHLISIQGQSLIRNDLVRITLQGALYRDQDGNLMFHHQREFSLIEKRMDDPDDVADPMVGDKVTMRIPCLEETILHVSTTPDYAVPCDEFQETYPEFWRGLHPDIQKEIEKNQVNIFVNPSRCRLTRNSRGWIQERLFTLYIPLFRFRAEYRETRLSSDAGSRYSRKQGFRVEVGFPGTMVNDEVRRTGAFLYKIPPRDSSEKGVLIFLSGQLMAKENSPASKPNDGMSTTRHILISYGMFMAGGGLAYKAHNYGLYLPNEPSADRGRKNRHYWTDGRHFLNVAQIRADWPEESEEQPEVQEQDSQETSLDPEGELPEDPVDDGEGTEEDTGSDDEPSMFGQGLTAPGSDNKT